MPESVDRPAPVSATSGRPVRRSRAWSNGSVRAGSDAASRGRSTGPRVRAPPVGRARASRQDPSRECAGEPATRAREPADRASAEWSLVARRCRLGGCGPESGAGSRPGREGTMSTDRYAIAIVGAGPRGAGLLERLAASVRELLPAMGNGALLDVHLIDPYPAGAGRIWRHAQSPLLAMNSMAADVTMFTDDSVRCDGPVVPGPSMWEWAQDLRAGGGGDELGPELAAELRALTASTFPTRRLQSAYLGWVLQQVIARLPVGMRAHVHEC